MFCLCRFSVRSVCRILTSLHRVSLRLSYPSLPIVCLCSVSRYNPCLSYFRTLYLNVFLCWRMKQLNVSNVNFLINYTDGQRNWCLFSSCLFTVPQHDLNKLVSVRDKKMPLSAKTLPVSYLYLRQVFLQVFFQLWWRNSLTFIQWIFVAAGRWLLISGMFWNPLVDEHDERATLPIATVSCLSNEMT